MSDTADTGQTAIAEAPSGAGPTPPAAVGTATPNRPTGPLGGWGSDLIAFVALLVMAGAGTSLYFRAMPQLTLGLVGGLVTGLGCTRWWRAVLVAAIAVPCGFFLASQFTLVRWHAGFFWLPQGLQAAATAAGIGAVVCFAIGQSPRLKTLLAALAVLALVATMWFSALNLATARDNKGILTLEQLNQTPKLAADSSDEDIYRAYVFRLRAGQPYYPMAVGVLTEMNQLRSSPVATHSALSYRLPTLYRFLAALPPSSGVLVNAILIACSLGVMSAYVLARQFVRQVPALLAASLVASVFAGYSGPMLLDTESWAGILALLAVTLVVVAYRRQRHTLALHTLAAVAAFAAASMRELAVAFLVLGLAAALSDRTGPRRRAWIPWAAACVATLGVYVAHAVSAQRAYMGVANPETHGFPWLHLDGSGLVAAVALLGSHAWLIMGVVWVLVLLGMAGSVLAPRDLPTRVMLSGAALVGPLVLLALHPPGSATYGVPGYWGDLVMPTTLACVPLAFVWLRDVGRNTDPALATQQAGSPHARPSSPEAEERP